MAAVQLVLPRVPVRGGEHGGVSLGGARVQLEGGGHVVRTLGKCVERLGRLETPKVSIALLLGSRRSHKQRHQSDPQQWRHLAC